MKNLILTCLLAMAMFGCDNPFTASKKQCTEGYTKNDSIIHFDTSTKVNDKVLIKIIRNGSIEHTYTISHSIDGNDIRLYNRFKMCPTDDYSITSPWWDTISYNFIIDKIGLYDVYLNDSLLKDIQVEVKP
jgi:hypothetical protein